MGSNNSPTRKKRIRAKTIFSKESCHWAEEFTFFIILRECDDSELLSLEEAKTLAKKSITIVRRQAKATLFMQGGQDLKLFNLFENSQHR